jgi:hypothetical protein
LTIWPWASTLATKLLGAFSYRGLQAQISQKWLRKEPPKAAWKKLSASVYSSA